MNDFLKDYEYFYHYTEASSLPSILERGLEPRTSYHRSGRETMISCWALRVHMIQYLKDLGTYPGQPIRMVCRVPSKVLIPLSLGLDWSSGKTKVHWDSGWFPHAEPRTHEELDATVIHSIEKVGVLAVHDIVDIAEMVFFPVVALTRSSDAEGTAINGL